MQIWAMGGHGWRTDRANRTAEYVTKDVFAQAHEGHRYSCLLVWTLSASGHDAQRGRLIYETHCGACHYERLHDRAHTKIGGLRDMRDEVSRCAPQTGRRFSLDEREDPVPQRIALQIRPCAERPVETDKTIRSEK